MSKTSDRPEERHHFGYFDAKYLWPLQPFVDFNRKVDPLRFHRGCIFVEPAPMGGVYVGAVTGFAMVVVHDPNGRMSAPVTVDMPDAAFKASLGPEPVIMTFENDSSGGPAVETRDRQTHEEIIMAKKYRNLIDRITADTNMLEAFRLTSRGKRMTPGCLEFKEFSILNLQDLAVSMRDGSYRMGAPYQFTIFDPKERLISALPFADRVAQHALCAVIGPIFEATLLPRAFACRPGKGTHAAAISLQSDMRRLTHDADPLYALKTDFSRYFASIEHAALWQLIDAKISCRATRRLIEAMLPRDGIGLPIGSLTSQIFANVYAGVVDRHLQQELGERYWYRYMDDIVVLGRSTDHLRRIRTSIEDLSREKLGLRFSKWSIQPTSRGVNFVGYRIWPTHKLLRRDSVIRARRKIKAYRAAGDHQRLEKFLAAWTGHAHWADSRNLLKSLNIASNPEGRAFG